MSFLDDAALDGLRAHTRCLTTGDVLDERFELREGIGHGAMGRVFSAWDRDASRLVAIKLVREPRDGARFELEVAALSQLEHPGIVRYVAHGQHGSTAYVAMDLLTGETLASRLLRGTLSHGEVVSVVTATAKALAAVHAADLVHRDVKPNNLLLVDGELAGVCLIDFGLARDQGHRPSRFTKTGALVGTPGYMAPEQVRGDELLDGSADIFALGCVLHECLTGRPAFSASTEVELFAKIMLEAASVPMHAPASLQEMLAAMLAKDASKRPTANQLLGQLEEVLVDSAVSSSATSQFRSGDVIAGKYELGKELGRGGMGMVVAARHRELGTQVALKILLRDASGKDQQHNNVEQARFLREAQAAARLESEHAVRVLDIGRVERGPPFIVMERLRGCDLATLLRDEGRLPHERAVGLLLEACEAIAEAHALGIVHRDIKPANLFLTKRRDGTPLIKVLDFGISKITRPLDAGSPDAAAMSITSPNAIIGSAAYMSPEQLRASKTVDPRTDIWSLGVVLFELIEGNPPFVSENAAAMGAMIASDPAPRMSTQIPTALVATITRCLEKKADARFANIAELAEALVPHGPEQSNARAARIRRVLAHVQDSEEIVTPGPGAHATARAWDASSHAERTQRSRWKLALAAGALLAIIAVSLSQGPFTNESNAAPAEADRQHEKLSPAAPSPRAPDSHPSASVPIAAPAPIAASAPTAAPAPTTKILPSPARPTPTPTQAKGPGKAAVAPDPKGDVDLNNPALESR